MDKEGSQLIRGLEGVVAAETKLCDLDGKNGRLAYGGYDIEDLARRASFEEVCHLLWHGDLPNTAQLDKTTLALIAAREIPGDLVQTFRLMPKATEPRSVQEHRAQVRDALRQLCWSGIVGRVFPPDASRTAGAEGHVYARDETKRVMGEPATPLPVGKTLPELTAELAERRAKLEGERRKVELAERELEARRTRIEKVNQHLDRVETRPLGAGGGS